jgi:hypothetical protein
MAGQQFLTLPRTIGSGRRKAERYRRSISTTWRPFGMSTSEWWVGTVWDLSTAGLSLVVRTPPPSGNYLDVSLQTVGDAAPLARVVRVRRVVPRPDGSWLVGCSFVRPLCAEDLQASL